MQARRSLSRGTGVALVLACLPGCHDASGPATQPASAGQTAAGGKFDSSATGTITGQVLWDGELPKVPAWLATPPFGPPYAEQQTWKNPNAPVIDPESLGVRDAVVFLRGIDPQRSRPWGHGPVRLELYDGQVHVLQDGLDSRVGFVRTGDAVVMVSKETMPHALRGSGAAFFTLMLPDANQPLERRLLRKGEVELTSGIGYYWLRGYLLVDDHPYYARSDGQGRFALREVPAGRYQLVCWHPSWLEQRHDRDPETALISRLVLRPPVVQEAEVQVDAGGSVVAHFQLATAQFLATGTSGPP